jgi:hypothetical protein
VVGLAGVAATLVVGRGQSDAAAFVRDDGDERQRGIHQQAVAAAASAMAAVAFVGGVVSAVINDGDVGPWGWICGVGGASYLAALTWLQRRS